LPECWLRIPVGGSAWLNLAGFLFFFRPSNTGRGIRPVFERHHKYQARRREACSAQTSLLAFGIPVKSVRDY
jgi:hypothetical protein